MQKRFGAVRASAWLLRFFGVLLALAGIVFGLLFMIGPWINLAASDLLSDAEIIGTGLMGVFGFVIGIQILLTGLFGGLIMYAVGGMLAVMLAVEENTRRTTQLLEIPE